MSVQSSEFYVTGALALQEVAVAPDAAEAIASTLSAQLGAVADAYASLPFEAEPPTFLVAQAAEKR
jgi:hypothetical protein